MRTDIDKTIVFESLSYDHETGLIKWKKGPRVGKEAGCVSAVEKRRVAYRLIRIDGVLMRAHRIAWLLHYGDYPVGQIDHINGNGVDNRIANLRCVTAAENRRNMRMLSNNKSGVCGVYYSTQRSKWRSYIVDNGKRICVGTFSIFEDAVKARKEWEKKLGYADGHGEKRPEHSHVPVRGYRRSRNEETS